MLQTRLRKRRPKAEWVSQFDCAATFMCARVCQYIFFECVLYCEHFADIALVQYMLDCFARRN